MTMDEARSSVTKLNAYTLQMCNSNNVEEIAQAFVECKDLLINLYKYNVERITLKSDETHS